MAQRDGIEPAKELESRGCQRHLHLRQAWARR
jgi:hypothetical protein